MRRCWWNEIIRNLFGNPSESVKNTRTWLLNGTFSFSSSSSLFLFTHFKTIKIFFIFLFFNLCKNSQNALRCFRKEVKIILFREIVIWVISEFPTFVLNIWREGKWKVWNAVKVIKKEVENKIYDNRIHLMTLLQKKLSHLKQWKIPQNS